MTNTPDTAQKLLDLAERHDWRCDCEWCWLGVTNTPQPPHIPLWKRIKAALKAIASTKEGL